MMASQQLLEKLKILKFVMMHAQLTIAVKSYIKIIYYYFKETGKYN